MGLRVKTWKLMTKEEGLVYRSEILEGRRDQEEMTPYNNKSTIWWCLNELDINDAIDDITYGTRCHNDASSSLSSNACI